MSDRTNNFYVTTPIYYGTGKPHLGSLYSTLLADIISRWQKLLGKRVFFLTGTDEHGQKIMHASQKAGKQPKEFVDQFISAYKQAWSAYHINYTKFIRTTDAEHKAGVQAFIQKLIDNGAVYKGAYEGWYCTPCETFVATKQEQGDEQSIMCSSCGRETIAIAESSYYFKLSAYQEKLLDFYRSHADFIIPKERFNEVMSFVQSGLHDLSISRASVSWGVPFPGDEQHTVYVWVDALCNYISAIGYGEDNREKEFNEWWPANLHVLGKDIIKFHAIYWPALLMAADLPVPKQLLVHGWIKVNEQKMSKSIGNVVDPIDLKEEYGVDPVRYYLVRHIPVNQDGSFSTEDLERCITSDLANDLGNLLQRVVVLAHKNDLFDVVAPFLWSQSALALRDQAWNMLEDMESKIGDCQFHLAYARLWEFIKLVNTYFHEQEPWKLVKTDKKAFDEVISAVCHSLRMIAILAWPVMPEKMEHLLHALGVSFDLDNHVLEHLELGIWKQGFLLKKIEPLFKKYEKKELENSMKDAKAEDTEKKEAYITIDDVAKVELIVGTIMACDPVEKSDKLLNMQVDFGKKGMRQILAGIAKKYKPEDLIGKQNIFVYNLKPRKMLGLESQGMMMLADGAERIAPTANVPNGTRLR